jgi:hypothetical protein
MRDYIRSSVQLEVVDEKTKATSKIFQRPTLVEKKVRVYLSVLKLVQQYSNLILFYFIVFFFRFVASRFI